MPCLVYILTNPTMPDLIKIGTTTDKIEKRLKQLSSHTGVPVPFELYYCCEVEDKNSNLERTLHFSFDDHRINPKREFFRIDPEKVKFLLQQHFEIQEITLNDDIVDSQEEQRSLDRERSRRANFKFSMAGIHPGAEISFAKDETIKAIVKGSGEIEFEGKTASLNRITLDILRDRFGANWKSVQAASQWNFGNETLNERRLRMEDDNLSDNNFSESSAFEDSNAQRNLEKSNQKKPAFTFPMVNISPGEKITFKEDENIFATVVDDKKIEFDGKRGAISTITKEILNSRFGKNVQTTRGPDWWKFRGETLTERRERMGV